MHAIVAKLISIVAYRSRAMSLVPALACLLPVLVAIAPLRAGATEAAEACEQETKNSQCIFIVLVPRFASQDVGPGDIGSNVALTLVNQVFRKFEVSIPWGSPENEADNYCCFPRDTVAILGSPLDRQSHLAALDRAANYAERQTAQIVLWGNTWKWFDNVVVQPYLSIGRPPNVDPGVVVETTNTPPGGIQRQRPFLQSEDRSSMSGEWNLWEITHAKSNGEVRTLRLDGFPRDFYDLPQISIPAARVDEFDSLDGIRVCRDVGGIPPSPEAPCEQIGVTGTSIEALRHEGEWTKIEWPDPDDPYGWITLPRLPDLEQDPIIEYIGALVFFMRGNWERARDGFTRVAENESATSSIRVDAALLRSAALFQLGKNCVDCDELFSAERVVSSCRGCVDSLAIAERISPFSEWTLRFQIMARIAEGIAELPAEQEALAEVQEWLATEIDDVPPGLYEAQFAGFVIEAEEFVDWLLE